MVTELRRRWAAGYGALVGLLLAFLILPVMPVAASGGIWLATQQATFTATNKAVPSMATYRNHAGHAEAIEIVFDPDQMSYRDLLEFFFQIHDPTTRNRQGNDIGLSYRSAIFYTSDEQKRVAEDTIADVEASGLWPAKVVTELAPAGDFWQAEPEHQDYLERIPNGYTCHFVRTDWKLPRRADVA